MSSYWVVGKIFGAEFFFFWNSCVNLNVYSVMVYKFNWWKLLWQDFESHELWNDGTTEILKRHLLLGAGKSISLPATTSEALLRITSLKWSFVMSKSLRPLVVSLLPWCMKEQRRGWRLKEEKVEEHEMASKGNRAADRESLEMLVNGYK
jgi:hypothetical protein